MIKHGSLPSISLKDTIKRENTIKNLNIDLED